MAGVPAASASSTTKAAGIAESSTTKRWDVAVGRRLIPPRGPMASMCSPSSALTAQRVAGPRPSIDLDFEVGDAFRWIRPPDGVPTASGRPGGCRNRQWLGVAARKAVVRAHGAV